MKKVTINRLEALNAANSEALNTVCSNLVFAAGNLKKIMITGVSESEGKSYVAMRMLETMSSWGKRVVLVDCDLRRSTLLESFDIKTSGEAVGLAHYLSGSHGIDDVLYETNLPGAYIVPQGQKVANPVAMLRSESFTKLLNDLAERFDIVLVDTPPVGLVVDAAEVAASCDGTVFVCEYARTSRKDLALAKKQIMTSGCPVLGCVINKVDFSTLSSKAYYNRAYYMRMKSAYCAQQSEQVK